MRSIKHRQEATKRGRFATSGDLKLVNKKGHDLVTGICRKLAFRCPKMAESRNEKTSQNQCFARFGGILSGFVRIRSEPAGVATISYNWLISSILSVWLCGSVMIWTLVDVAACLIFVRQILRFKGNEFLCNKKLFGCVL